MEKDTLYGDISKQLWLNSSIISKHLDNSLGAIHGIGLSEYMVLHYLMEAPNHALRRIDVAEAMARTASGITRMLMPMEKIGLIEKHSNARDARVSVVKLTAAGEEMYANATVTLNARSESLLKNIDRKKATGFLQVLEAI